ncbi:MAG: thioredoxin-dependent thiol peroxidase [Candidatus Sumerlaeia bacterium]
MTRPSPLEPGSKAPVFSLLNQDGRPVALGDFAGRWLVLYFYPRDNTPGCTKEACEFTSALKDFETLGASVVGVSPDSPESHKRFIQKHALGIELLSDPDHKVAAAYGAWGPKTMYGKLREGIIRSTVLIDPQGRIAAHWPAVKVNGHVEQVRARLKELKGSAD